MHRNKRHGARGGAGDVKKLKKYINIGQHLEANHKKVYDLFETLTLVGALKPRRGQQGITFIVPSSSYLKRMERELKDNLEVAVDMAQMLVVPLLLKSTEDWGKMKDDIGTISRKRIIVKDIEKDKVILENGDLTLDKKFTPIERFGPSKRDNMAVWVLNGEIDFEGAPKTGGKYVYGSYEEITKPSREGGASDRYTIEMWKKIVIKDDMTRTFNKTEQLSIKPPCIADIVVNFINYVEARGDNKCKELLRYSTTPNPYITFFLIFGSYGEKGFWQMEFLAQAINDGLNAIVDKPVTRLKEFCSNNTPSNAEELALVKSIIRDDLLTSLSIMTGEKIVKYYEDVDETNTINADRKTVSNVYPASVHEKYKNCPGLHLARDEFIHKARKCFEDYVHIPKDMKRMKEQELREFYDKLQGMYGIDININPDNSYWKYLVKYKKELSERDISVVESFIEISFLFIHNYDRKISIMGGNDEEGENAEYLISNEEYENDDSIDLEDSILLLKNLKEADPEKFRKLCENL